MQLVERGATMKYGRILLLVLAVAVLAAVGSELGRGADVARSAPAAATDISLDSVTILGADTDGNSSTIEIPLIGNTLDFSTSFQQARIVKEITITVPVATTVRLSAEFAPPEGTVWHCMAPFVDGGDANLDQGCTVGSPSYSLVVGQPPFRGLPECQWTWTNLPAFPAAGGAHKVLMPWIDETKCERFVDYSTLVATKSTYRHDGGGAAPGCRITEVSAPAWVPPAPAPNPYDLGDCILDWHQHFEVVTSGTIKLRVVDELELKPSLVGTYNISEDFNVMPVGDTDPNLANNKLTTSFTLSMNGFVGGLAELPGVSGSSGFNYVGLAGLAAVALVVLGASGWYARRRWVR
ncbi:MAG: hypothetical protein MUP14_02885 [Dehalococcoidia bacterium]|nr:hypothetical protein [Dehalococcoidia bacterium]